MPPLRTKSVKVISDLYEKVEQINLLKRQISTLRRKIVNQHLSKMSAGKRRVSASGIRAALSETYDSEATKYKLVKTLAESLIKLRGSDGDYKIATHGTHKERAQRYAVFLDTEIQRLTGILAQLQKLDKQGSVPDRTCCKEVAKLKAQNERAVQVISNLVKQLKSPRGSPANVRSTFNVATKPQSFPVNVSPNAAANVSMRSQTIPVNPVPNVAKPRGISSSIPNVSRPQFVPVNPVPNVSVRPQTSYNATPNVSKPQGPQSFPVNVASNSMQQRGNAVQSFPLPLSKPLLLTNPNSNVKKNVEKNAKTQTFSKSISKNANATNASNASKVSLARTRGITPEEAMELNAELGPIKPRSKYLGFERRPQWNAVIAEMHRSPQSSDKKARRLSSISQNNADREKSRLGPSFAKDRWRIAKNQIASRNRLSKPDIFDIMSTYKSTRNVGPNVSSRNIGSNGGIAPASNGGLNAIPPPPPDNSIPPPPPPDNSIPPPPPDNSIPPPPPDNSIPPPPPDNSQKKKRIKFTNSEYSTNVNSARVPDPMWKTNIVKKLYSYNPSFHMLPENLGYNAKRTPTKSGLKPGAKAGPRTKKLQWSNVEARQRDIDEKYSVTSNTDKPGEQVVGMGLRGGKRK